MAPSRVGPSSLCRQRKNFQTPAFEIAPFFEAAATDPVEAFVAEASRHPVFDLTESL